MSKLFRFLRPSQWSIIMTLVFVFLQSLSTLYLPRLMSQIVDTGIVRGNTPYILRVGGFMLVVAIAGVLCSVAASWLASRVSGQFGRTLRSVVFEHVQRFSLHEFDVLGTASLITRTTNDITQVQMLVNMMLRMMVMAPLMAIGGIIMSVLTDAKLSLVIVVVVPVLGLTIYLVMSKGVGLFRSMQMKIDALNRVLRESLTGVRVIRSFNRIEYETMRFDAANKDLTDTAVRVNQLMATMMPAMMLIVNLSTIAIIWFGSIRINNGHMQVGNLMAFLQYLMQILSAVMMVSMMFFMIPRASASGVRIREVLDTAPEIVDPPASVPNRPACQQRAHSGVEFRGVTFRYPGAEKPALLDVSFTARAGRVTAIIGGTGSGKSTLVSLIPRFYDVEAGEVLVDGMDVRHMEQETLRLKLGFVSQTAVLFSGSVADNIRYGKPDASLDEIRRAAEIAQADEFIETMDGGYDALLTQGGGNLSGGQKQRLTIARAVARCPEIYVFDDSFSALDFKTDAKLRAALQPIITESTVLIVAQRVSTVMSADEIIVLDQGSVAGIGTHEQLCQTCSVYQEIVASQLGEGETA
jgi:ATP-binding cassette, subfamily B, multidrug efflux pump